MSQKVPLVTSDVLHVYNALRAQGQFLKNLTIAQKNLTVAKQPEQPTFGR